MAKILVHLRNSLEHPKRAALENPAEFAQPNMLVQLSLEHDRMFTY
jgi:hypothetical protein